MSQSVEKPAVRRPKPLKKRMSEVEPMPAFDAHASVSTADVSRSEIENLLDKARIEQANNAACRALIDANDRLISHIFAIAELHKSQQSASAKISATEINVPVHAADSADSQVVAVKVPDRVLIGERLRKSSKFNNCASYKKAREEMIQAVIRNYSLFDGSMGRKQLSQFLGTSITTIDNYVRLIKRLREQRPN